MTSLRRALTLVAVAAVSATAAPAALAATLSDPEVLPAASRTVTASGVTQKNCMVRPLGGASGVSFSTWTAPRDGFLTVKLTGGRQSGDWDLALFGADGKRLVGSSGFTGNEVAQTWVMTGDVIGVQACRRAGAAAKVGLVSQMVRIDGGRAKTPGTVSLVEIKGINPEKIAQLEELGIDLGHDQHGDHVTAYLTDLAGQSAQIRKLGLGVEVKEADMAAYQRERVKKDAEFAKRVNGRSALPSGRTSYRNYEDIQAEMKKLVADFPDLVSGSALKMKTFQGRDLNYLEIAKNVKTPNDGKPIFVMVGMHHAREWPAAEAPLEWAGDMVKSYGKDPRITKLLDTTRIVVMPLTNADGYIHSRNSPLSEGLFVGQYRRKNCSFPIPVGLAPCEAQLGVDPNRNYGQFWGGPGASSVPAYDTYRGPGPFSENEPGAVRELYSKFPGTTMISTHNVAALVLRPQGLKEAGLAPDEARLKALGDAMGKVTGYTSQYGWQLYDTTGTTDDWTYNASGVFSYTIEIGPSGGDFHGPYEDSMVNEYVGVGKFKGKGLREAYTIAAEHSNDRQDNAVLQGRAPAGRTLKLEKAFKTTTYAVCPINVNLLVEGCETAAPHGAVQELPDKLETSIVVGPSGRFEWVVNPSTRPLIKRAGKTESYKLTCSDNSTVVETKDVTVDRGQVLKLDLPCGGTLVPDEVAPAAKKPAAKKKKKAPTCKKGQKSTKKKPCTKKAKKKKARRK